MGVRSENKRKEYCLGIYKELIDGFIERGYKTKKFSSSIKPEKDLILRHDIDFDCSYANVIASLEKELGVKSTYFFLLTNDSYNLISKRNIMLVSEIKEKGHEVSLHFDPVVYGDNFLDGFRFERNVFEKTFKTEIKIISIHRPTDFFLNYDKPIDGVEHTYQKKYFKDIKYVSDSQGAFRFGHPFTLNEFKDKKSIHLLTHPIWWQGNGGTNIEVLQQYIEDQKAFLGKHIGDNCKPFRKYLNKQ